jgi:hypothetical protein
VLNPLNDIYYELSAHRRAELERRLELLRQLRDGSHPRISLRRRLANQLADVLIAIGEDLRRRGTPPCRASELELA